MKQRTLDEITEWISSRVRDLAEQSDIRGHLDDAEVLEIADLLELVAKEIREDYK